MEMLFMESVQRGMSWSVLWHFVGLFGYKTHGKVNGNIGKSKSKGMCMCFKWKIRECHCSDVHQSDWSSWT